MIEVVIHNTFQGKQRREKRAKEEAPPTFLISAGESTKGAIAQDESTGKKKKAVQAIQAVEKGVSANKSTPERKVKKPELLNKLSAPRDNISETKPEDDNLNQDKLPDHVSNQSLNGQEKPEAIGSSTLAKVSSKPPSKDIKWLPATDKTSSKTSKMSKKKAKGNEQKKEEEKGQKKKKNPFVADKFCCPLPGCGFIPRLASKQQMYAHYEMEHYRWVNMSI